MNHSKRLTSILAVVALCGLGSSGADAATVTVDQTRESITIDGFGVFGSRHVWWDAGPYYDQAFLNLLIDSLGVTILRTEIYPWPVQADMWRRQIPYLKAIGAKAAQSNEPLKFFASIWTPPGSMKTSGSEIGGTLKADQRDAFGQYVSDYVRRWKDSVGYDLHSVSPQNEPALSPGYNSCPYMPDEYSEMFKAVAAKFKQNNTKCWLNYADNIPWTGSDWQGQVVEAVCRDAVADSIGEIMSMHYATDNAAETNEVYKAIAQMAAGAARRTANIGRKTKLWNTEFGGQFDSWDENIVDESGQRPGGAWKLATDYMLCLLNNFTAVIYWQGCETMQREANGRHYSLFYVEGNNYILGPRFHVAKQIYRYVRPGAIRIGCTSSDTASIWAVAYRHKQQQTHTIILMNRSNSVQSAVIQGTGLASSMNVYQTSPTQNCVKIGTVAPGGTVSLPVKSLTTIYNVPSVAVSRPDDAAPRAVPAIAPRAPEVWYAIDGRTLQGHTPGRDGAVGVYVAHTTGVRTTRILAASR